MAKKTKRAVKKTEPAIKQLADSLKEQARLAHQSCALLDTKAMIANAIWENGASLESLAEKIGWTTDKLNYLLRPDTDIPIRELADMATGLSKHAVIEAVEKKTGKCEFSVTTA